MDGIDLGLSEYSDCKFGRVILIYTTILSWTLLSIELHYLNYTHDIWYISYHLSIEQTLKTFHLVQIYNNEKQIFKKGFDKIWV